MSLAFATYNLLALALDAGNGSFLDHVVAPANMRRAFRRVVSNRGAPGADGITVGQLAATWPQLKSEVTEQMLTGSYRPSPIRRVAVPKSGGKGVRVLGIPTVVDRLVQQAIAQPLCALLDVGFSPHSFGFRPGRSAHDALFQARRFAEAGFCWVLHLDLEKFFDCVPLNLLLARLQDHVRDARLLELVRRCISAPFADGRPLMARAVGLPQGSPLSPLLANLFLDELDRRLFDAGFPFCRYADDVCLYFASQDEAREALAMITPWIETDLKLRINREKTRIVPLEQDVFLGYRFQLRGGHLALSPSFAACASLRRAVHRLLVRQRSANPRELIGETLMPLLHGWAAYFSLSEDPCLFESLDRWTLNEIGCWLWVRLRNPQRRARALVKLGTPSKAAWALASCALPTKVVIKTAVFGTAYSRNWLRAHGWRPCLQPAGTDRGASFVEQPDQLKFSDSSDSLDVARRAAARECEIYEWRGVTSVQ